MKDPGKKREKDSLREAERESCYTGNSKNESRMEATFK